MTTSEKVAYLKGLAEGLGLDTEKKEGKLLTTIIDILEDLALDQEDLGADVAELEEGLDAVSEDLEDVEDVLFGPVDDDDDEDGPCPGDGDDDEDGPCPGDEDDDEDGEPWDGETTFYECECPSCGETVTFDEGVLSQGSIQCPSCGEQLEFEIGEAGPDGE